MDTQYLQSALKVTQLALRARQAPIGETTSLVLLLLLAELEMRWNEMADRGDLPTPSEIRALI